MGYVLLLCEGSSEACFVGALLERGLLALKTADLIGEEPQVARQFSQDLLSEVRRSKKKPIAIFRMGDKLSDILRRPTQKAIYDRFLEGETKILTKPELEILFIINEGEYDGYLKWRNANKPNHPSDFYKALHPEYRKDRRYIEAYLGNMDDLEIVSMLKAYKEKRFATHKKDELCLYDLLRDDLKK